MTVAATPAPFDPVENFEDFFRFYQDEPNKFKYREKIHELYADSGNTLLFIYDDLVDYDPKLAHELYDNPEKLLDDAVEAFKNLLRIESGGVIDETIEYFIRIDTGKDQLAVSLRGLRAEHIDKMVCVHGILVRTTPVKPQIITATFECQDCGHQFEVEQFDTILIKPAKCMNPGCKNKAKFILVSRDSKFIDWQSVHIQESPEELPAGRIPRAVQAILTHTLVERARPGDRVKIIGVYRSVPQENARGNKSTIFKTFLQVNNIASKEDETDSLHTTDEELEEILRLAKEPMIQKKIGRSVAPSIMGMDQIKMATALLLFGGVAKVKPDGGHIRGDIHMLTVGDPGTGKSQILHSAYRLSPRGVFTSGKGSSAAGLTAAVMKDADTGGMSLEAGAIVLADGGIACIDEFDKMRNEDRVAIHERMEQQSYHYDTEILSTDGNRIHIGSFVDNLMENYKEEIIQGLNCEILPYNQVSVFSTDFQKIFKTPINRISRHKAPDHFYRFTFTNGRKITVTPEHPLFIFRSTKLDPIAARDCVIGDFIPIPSYLPNSSKPICLELSDTIPDPRAKVVNFPSTLSRQLTRILGYFITEGHSSKGSTVELGFTNTDPAILDDFKSLMMDIFGISPSINKKSDNSVTLRFLSTELYKWMGKNFPEVMTTARYKRVPAKLLGTNVDLIREFLRSAFKGDGSLESTSVCYRTSSKGLSEDYQDLLLKLGIQSRIVFDVHNESYKVYIRGQSLIQFFYEIIEETDPRYEKFQELIQPDNEKTHHYDVFPMDIAKKLIRLKKHLAIPYKDYFNRHLAKNYGVTRNIVEKEIMEIKGKLSAIEHHIEFNSDITQLRDEMGYSREALAKISGLSRRNLDYYENWGYSKEKRNEIRYKVVNSLKEQLMDVKIELKSIEMLMNSDILWDRITDIEIINNEGENYTPWVYDLTVEPSHTFIGKGVVLHNTISIAKAGIVATLNSRTSILAAANPHLGRYNPWKTATDNIRLSPPLLSRFDLIFVVIDKPDANTDRDIANFILDLHMQAETPKTCESEEGTDESTIPTPQNTIQGNLLKKYIHYAKKTCKPRLTPTASKKISEFYLKMRAQGGEDNAAIAMVARNLEGIIRLSEAHAKMALKTSVDEEDVEAILELVTRSLQDIGFDKETGTFDIDRLMTGHSRSQVSKIGKILEILRDMEEENGNKPVELDALKERVALEGEMKDEDIEEALKTLKREGDIIYPKNGLVKSVKH
ncbi:MAG: XRE family transcriptional regulator [Promethearchaeota archaeon CR_4]|nr:MAG: XRE family transcriptional regulator [Candidatus Lokiarchaeota archaeon CR_4]